MAKSSKKKLEVVKEPIKYDKTKSYKWEPTDIFELTGEEFHVIFNFLKHSALIQAPSAAQTLYAYEVAEIILSKGVEKEIVKEIPPEELAQEAQVIE